jgi:hypothetical protein
MIKACCSIVGGKLFILGSVSGEKGKPRQKQRDRRSERTLPLKSVFSFFASASEGVPKPFRLFLLFPRPTVRFGRILFFGGCSRAGNPGQEVSKLSPNWWHEATVFKKNLNHCFYVFF